MTHEHGDDQEPRLLRTRRCELVPVGSALAKEIVAGNYENARPAEGWPHADTSIAVSHVLSDSPADVWLIQCAGRTIGDCGTHGPADRNGTVEIGYGLASPFRGHGYATEVVSVLSQWLLARPEVARVRARAAIGNVPSWRVLEKAGFTRVGGTPTMFEYELVSQQSD
jgi:RimJ/RimL family protein N-acetyltransferase